MTYETPLALRAALEQRLLNQSEASGVGLDRLRRRVVFERTNASSRRSRPTPTLTGSCWPSSR